MAIYSFTVPQFQPGTGVADAVDLVDGAFMAIQGGAALQRSDLDEVTMGGEAATSSPMIMLIARDSTVFATPTALATPNSFGLLDAASLGSASPPVACIACTTQPQRSNSVSLAKKCFLFNAAGGVVRANYANTKDRFSIVGASASLGEFSLSSFTGSTASVDIGTHLIIETA